MPPPSSNHPLKIIPKELVFPAPLNRVITNILKLHNSSQASIAYKVKTTAPQRYCVRPNNGVLAAGETIEVQVLLNYVKDAPPNLDIKDKFQIQSIVMTGPFAGLEVGEVWAKATNEQIIKQKLKSRFTPAPPATTAKSPVAAPNPNPNPTPTLSVTPGEPVSNHTSSSSSSLLQQDHSNQHHDTISSTTQTPEEPPTQTASESTQTSQPSLRSSQQTLPPPPISPSPAQSLELHSSSQKALTESGTLYSTPVITSVSPQDWKKDAPHPSSLDQSTELVPKETTLQDLPQHASPTPTGDYIVDTVANFSTLRKALEQVATLKSDKESVIKDNQRLNDQVKMLVDRLQRAKEESQTQTGLRQRTVHTTSPSIASPARVDTAQSHVQIQTKVLLILILFFSFIGFLLGRLTH